MNRISTKELFNILKEKQVSIIDIREPYEHQTGHVPGSKNIPMTSILVNYNSLLKKNETYYIICQSGNRSTVVSQFLEAHGFNVINVLGGHSAWPGRLD
jgi:rhodanese-related sulfurtransferase